MNKALTLTLLAAASSACVAQTATPDSVTLYGIVDAGVTYTTGLANNKSQVVSGIMEGSRFGLRGSEDLGGGWRALFTLEHRAEINTGSVSNRPPSGTQVPDRLNQAALMVPGFTGYTDVQRAGLQAGVSAVAAGIAAREVGVNLPGRFWDRQAYVGLVTPYGAVLAGRQYTPAYEIQGTFDTLGTQSSLAFGQVAALPPGFDIRVSNALQYRIVLGGITASAMYAFGGVAGNSKADRFGGAMVMYKADNFAVGAGYNQRNNDVGLESLKSLAIGASLNVGPGKVSAMVVQIEDDNPSGVSGIAAALAPQLGPLAPIVQSAFTNGLKQDARAFHIGYKLETGPNTFYVAYNSFNDRQAANADVDSYGVAYTYALSKRTDLNAVLAHYNNKGLGQAAPGQAGFVGGVTKSAGTDSNNLAFGIRHRF